MTHWIILMSTLAVVFGRPSNVPESPVEIEKQQILEIRPRELFGENSKPKDDKQVEDSTKEILEKIALVNERQGLLKKKPRPYYNFPFSYHRSNDQQFVSKKHADFKIPKNAFINPILDQIEKENEDSKDIKKIVVHQQSILLPNPYFQNVPPFGGVPQYYQMPYQVPTSDLEQQTVENVKNIVGSSQYPPLFNPYYDQRLPMPYYPYYPEQISPLAKQQWQWPLGQFFPIVIRDPFIHMMNAMTSMVTYGPSGAPSGTCAKSANEPRTQKNSKEKLDYSVANNGKGPEITVDNKDDSNLTTVIDIEDLEIKDAEPVKMTVNLRQSKSDLSRNPLIQALHIAKIANGTTRQSPPIRDQELFDDELAEAEDEKAEDISIQHQGTKKLVSKDNTGSGIFVHKIKVRKGGVAIAGPGGIATAGSGGTAIVGPNGFAYTHPDSLAIAGSGTKVVAVDPTINLSQIIMDHNKNKTRGDGHLPPRVGKIVAIGPVIYYNKG